MAQVAPASKPAADGLAPLAPAPAAVKAGPAGAALKATCKSCSDIVMQLGQCAATAVAFKDSVNLAANATDGLKPILQALNDAAAEPKTEEACLGPLKVHMHAYALVYASNQGHPWLVSFSIGP